MLATLNQFWQQHGCLVVPPHDLEMGAGTFHWATMLRVLGDKPWKAAYVQPCRRPADGRGALNPNRLHRYFQYQVIMKPPPRDVQDLYYESLRALGLNTDIHDIRFLEDNWESPSIGAKGLGWEVWLDGMEVTQFTYFQRLAGHDLSPMTAEITYGVERLAMFLQDKDTVFDLIWHGTTTYGDLFHQYEKEGSAYCYDDADPRDLTRRFDDTLAKGHALLERDMPSVYPAWERLLEASHAFNLLDASGKQPVQLRQQRILNIRRLAVAVATQYVGAE